MPIPAAWMPPAKMDRIIFHWTAGAHRASDLDKKHYHILVEHDGTVVKGVPSIALNQAPAKKGYAAHTLNCNSGSIGVSVCCMAGAIENPFSAGKYPMTEKQWTVLAMVIADLCRFYKITVTPKTVLSHAEVQGTLGIKQRGKWDIARLAFKPEVRGAKSVGDLMRSIVSALLNPVPVKTAPSATKPDPAEWAPEDFGAPVERKPDDPGPEPAPDLPAAPVASGRLWGAVAAVGAALAALAFYFLR